MSDTWKREYNRPDGWHESKRLERQARPAGRDLKLFEQDLELEEGPTLDSLIGQYNLTTIPQDQPSGLPS